MSYYRAEIRNGTTPWRLIRHDPGADVVLATGPSALGLALEADLDYLPTLGIEGGGPSEPATLTLSIWQPDDDLWLSPTGTWQALRVACMTATDVPPGVLLGTGYTALRLIPAAGTQVRVEDVVLADGVGEYATLGIIVSATWTAVGFGQMEPVGQWLAGRTGPPGYGTILDTEPYERSASLPDGWLYDGNFVIDETDPIFNQRSLQVLPPGGLAVRQQRDGHSGNIIIWAQVRFDPIDEFVDFDGAGLDIFARLSDPDPANIGTASYYRAEFRNGTGSFRIVRHSGGVDTVLAETGIVFGTDLPFGALIGPKDPFFVIFEVEGSRLDAPVELSLTVWRPESDAFIDDQGSGSFSDVPVPVLTARDEAPGLIGTGYPAFRLISTSEVEVRLDDYALVAPPPDDLAGAIRQAYLTVPNITTLSTNLFQGVSGDNTNYPYTVFKILGGHPAFVSDSSYWTDRRIRFDCLAKQSFEARELSDAIANRIGSTNGTNGIHLRWGDGVTTPLILVSQQLTAEVIRAQGNMKVFRSTIEYSAKARIGLPT